jgi:uroporphyrinogen decarboxylase
VKIKSGVGPVISNPIRSRADIDRLGEFHAEEQVPYVLDTIKILTQEQLDVPLIGFAGAPFTLASYMIEGGPSRSYNLTKSFMVSEPEAWQALMDKLADMTIAYLKAQIAAGAKIVQVFDSWVGALHVADYRTFIKPTMTRIVSEVKKTGVPVITFGVGASHLVNEWHDLPVDVVGLDWRMQIREAEERGVTKPVQGNLDPTLLIADWNVIEERAKDIIEQGVEHGAHIFNLGHGVFPDVQPATLKKLTEFVHTYSAQLRK